MRALPPALGAALTALGLAGLAEVHVATWLWNLAGVRDKPSVGDGRLAALASQHLALSLAALAAASLVGIGLGLLATRPWAGPGLRRLVDTISAASQAVPPVVVVALALPVFGFGPGPTALALLAYALLPVLRGTVAAIESVSPEALEAAEALGLTPAQILWRIELPLSAGLITEAVRVALALVIATASVGALAGTATLGTPIVAGLQNQNEIEIHQGAAATAALAFLADALVLAGLALVGRRFPR